MAHGYLKQFTEGKATVYSAGVETHGLNPRAVWAMNEDGIDISTHTSNHIDEYKAIDFELVLTVCDHAREACPWFPSRAQLIHHSFSDPSKLKGTEDEIKAAFRKTRSEIKAYCKNLAEKV
jgi:arsenate reductase